jgi:hypothetical protein
VTQGWKSKSSTEVRPEDLQLETIMHTEFHKRVQNKQECHSAPVRCVCVDKAKHHTGKSTKELTTVYCAKCDVRLCLGSVLMYGISLESELLGVTDCR